MSPEHRARQLVAELELVSHAPVVRRDVGRSSEHPGGRRPTGAAEVRDDKELGYHLKSHLHFRYRLERCHTNAGFERIANDAQKTLDAWRHSPKPPKDSIPWRELVAKDTRKARVVAAEWKVTKDYVWMLRRTYRDPAHSS